MRPTPPEKPLGNNIASSRPVSSASSRWRSFCGRDVPVRSGTPQAPMPQLFERLRDRGRYGGMAVESEIVERREVDELAHLAADLQPRAWTGGRGERLLEQTDLARGGVAPREEFRRRLKRIGVVPGIEVSEVQRFGIHGNPSASC